jgi:hypothetical protein
MTCIMKGHMNVFRVHAIMYAWVAHIMFPCANAGSHKPLTSLNPLREVDIYVILSRVAKMLHIF